MITSAKPAGLVLGHAAADALKNGPHRPGVSYGLLLLPSLFNGAVDHKELPLPLTVAYLLSAHLPFRFPLPEAVINTIEQLFDAILKGLPKESKGILYAPARSLAPMSELLQDASLVITDNVSLEQSDGFANVPQAVLCRATDHTRTLKLRNTEKLHDTELKAKLAVCAQLINAQSAGFTTEGHFSLSW